MSERLPDAIRKRLPAEKARAQAVAAAETPTLGLTELRKRRDALAEDLATGQYDLGGLVYEMAIRDHYRLDVVTRRAAEMQRVDAELAEAERLLRLEDAAASGACRFCGAMHAKGATFCWQCGERLIDFGQPGLASADPVTPPPAPAPAPAPNGNVTAPPVPAPPDSSSQTTESAAGPEPGQRQD